MTGNLEPGRHAEERLQAFRIGEAPGFRQTDDSERHTAIREP